MYHEISIDLLYLILAEFSSDGNKVNAFQNIIGIDSITRMLLEIAEIQAKDDVKYCMKFLCRSANLSNEVRKNNGKRSV